MVHGFDTKEYAVTAGGHSFSIVGPAQPDELLSDPDVEERHQQDDYMPYWATPWPSSVLLADYLVRRYRPPSEPVLEIGAGLGVLGIALGLAGWKVRITDYDSAALRFAEQNAKCNGVIPDAVEALDWRQPPSRQFAAIVAADVLYESRDHVPIARLLRESLKSDGVAWIGDPNRRGVDPFTGVAASMGLKIAQHALTQNCEDPRAQISPAAVSGRVFYIEQTHIPG